MRSRNLVAVAVLVAAMSFLVGNQIDARGPHGVSSAGVDSSPSMQAVPTGSARLPASAVTSEIPEAVVDPTTGEKLVIVDSDWRALEPFASRFAAPEWDREARNAIRLGAHHFVTDGLVEGSGWARSFTDPDMRSFPSYLVGKPFAGGPTDYFIVQAASPEAQTVLRGKLERFGVRIMAYIPIRAYLVEVNRQTLDLLRGHAEVAWVGFFHPAWRIDPKLDYIIESDRVHEIGMAVLFDGSHFAEGRSLRSQVEALGTEVQDVTRRSADWLVRIRGRAVLARELVSMPGCLWVERRVPKELHNNIARTSSNTTTGRGASSGPILDVEDVWARGIRGDGQVASASDSGLDTGNLGTLHQDFGAGGSSPQRQIAGYALGRSTWDDPENAAPGGHGTHTSGSIVGNGDLSGANPATNTFPSFCYAGTAPNASFVFQSVLDSGGGLNGIPSDLNALFQQAYDHVFPGFSEGARVHSNSWGSSVAGQYTTDSENLDEFVWNNQDMVITFAASNDGEDGKYWNGSTCANTGQPADGVIDIDSIGSPATAKNCITVGATENYRPDFVYEYPAGDCTSSNGFEQKAWGWGWCYENEPIMSDLMADDASGMGAFSSRGPVDDGRIKPDVVAPGIGIISTRTQQSQTSVGGYGDCQVNPSYIGDYTSMGGTSMANPLVAGTAVLVRQYYQDGWHANHSLVTNSSPEPGDAIAAPSAALIKATLINGAWDMTPGQYGTGGVQEIPPGWDSPRDFPNNAEGFGRVDVESSLFPGAGWGHDASRAMMVHDVSSGLSTGGSTGSAYDITVASSADPLRVTLVWTDPWPTLAAHDDLVNDLDLVVISPTAVRFYPNRKDWTGGSADNVNNVEQVFVTSPAPGTWTVRVDGASVPGNGQSGTTTQPFALVLSGVFGSPCSDPAGPPTGVSASATAVNQITLSWTQVSPSPDKYRIYRSTMSGGPYTLIDTIDPAADHVDSTVSGGETYYYVLRSLNLPNCDSTDSNEASATAYGDCTVAPSFGGLTSATALSDERCGARLEWDAPSAIACGDTVVYDVYRRQDPSAMDFSTPHAACVTDLFYEDTGLGTGEYFYVVRAEDGTVGNGGPCNGGNQTGHTTESSVVAGGTVTTNYASTDVPKNIPDNSAAGVSSTLSIGATGTISDIMLNVNISHTWKGDLIVRLIAPDTTEVTVHSLSGGSANNIVTTYDSLTSPDGPGTMADFDGRSLNGTWTLHAADRARFDTGAINSWSLDITTISTCDAVPESLQFFTATASSGQNLLEMRTPSSGSCSTVRVIRKLGSYPTSSSDGTLVGSEVACGGNNNNLQITDSSVSNGTTYYYAGFVNSGSEYSAMRTVSARPSTLSQVQWVFNTGASALAPPGLGSVYGVSNDRSLHGMVSGASGGTWPSSGSWAPMAMNRPAQGRPPVIPVGPAKWVYLGSQDGYVYGVDGVDGSEQWSFNTDPNTGDSVPGMVQASPSGIFAQYQAGAPDLVLVGTRMGGEQNIFYAINAFAGTEAWRYDVGDDGESIGIISGGAWVEYGATPRVYFTSRAYGTGATEDGTVWCLEFDGGSASRCSSAWPLALGDIDGSPVKRGDYLYVGNNAGTVYAIDTTDGSTWWSYATNDGPVKGFIWPDWATDDVYLSTTNTLWGLEDDGGSGGLLWQSSVVVGPSTPLHLNGIGQLLVGSRDGKLYRIDATNGNDAGVSGWPLTLGGSAAAVGSPAFEVGSDLAYAGTESGAVYAVSVQ